MSDFWVSVELANAKVETANVKVEGERVIVEAANVRAELFRVRFESAQDRDVILIPAKVPDGIIEGSFVMNASFTPEPAEVVAPTPMMLLLLSITTPKNESFPVPP